MSTPELMQMLHDRDNYEFTRKIIKDALTELLVKEMKELGENIMKLVNTFLDDEMKELNDNIMKLVDTFLNEMRRR